jgi:virginiamycin B lyase
MHIIDTKTPPKALLGWVLVVLGMPLLCCISASAQQLVRGTIKGAVTADQGQVVGFRVAAHNLDRRLWYIVFTKKGQYTVPQALPGRYEMTVDEPGFDSPKMPVQLGPGENKTADLAIKARPPQEDNSAFRGDDEGGQVRQRPGKIEYVNSMEEIFPPGPELATIKEQCTGCHYGGTSRPFGAMHYTRDAFYRGIERMMETGPPEINAKVIPLGKTPFDKQTKESLADYLAKSFGPGTTERKLRVDPLVLDEEVASNAIYVSYDVPDDLPLNPRGNQIGVPVVDGVVPQVPAATQHQLQAPFISPVDGNIWFSNTSGNTLLRLDPKYPDASERWKMYPVKGDPFVWVDGVAIDKQGRVYWAEAKGQMLGELDPATGRQIRHPVPVEEGSMQEVVVDKDGNVGFDFIWGSQFGRMDAITRKVYIYPTPTRNNGIYGLAVDQHGNLWGAGWQKGIINKWDADTESVKEYKVPNSWGQIRRIGVDSKGIVWASELITGILARLDPATGQLTEYKIPLSGANPYDCWPDKSDNIWMPDQAHSALIKFDPRTAQFTFYPMPQPHQSVPKIQVADDNTVWFGTRGKAIATGVHFYPNGYTAEARPTP